MQSGQTLVNNWNITGRGKLKSTFNILTELTLNRFSTLPKSSKHRKTSLSIILRKKLKISRWIFMVIKYYLKYS